MQNANLKQQLQALTQELRDLGVTGFACPADRINEFTPATLRSCVAWATELVKNIRTASN